MSLLLLVASFSSQLQVILYKAKAAAPATRAPAMAKPELRPEASLPGVWVAGDINSVVEAMLSVEEGSVLAGIEALLVSDMVGSALELLLSSPLSPPPTGASAAWTTPPEGASPVGWPEEVPSAPET